MFALGTSTRCALIALSLMLATGAAADAALIIDDFDELPAEVTIIAFKDPDPTLAKATDPAILGGQRDLLIDVKGTPKLISYSGTVGDGTFAGNAGVPGAEAILQYDGADADNPGPPAGLINSEGLGGLDLTAGGTLLAFRLDFLTIEGGAALETPLEIEVHGTGGVAAFVGMVPDAAVPSSYFARFSGFSNPAVLTDVTSIEVRINPAGASGVDFELDRVSTDIPEPGTLCLLGLGGLAVMRRRRR